MELIGRLVKMNDDGIMQEGGIELRLDYNTIVELYPQRSEKYANSSFEEFVKDWFSAIIVQNVPWYNETPWLEVIVTAALKEDDYNSDEE